MTGDDTAGNIDRTKRRIAMTWDITMAASALNISRAQYAGNWDILTIDQARAVETRLRLLVEETKENLAHLETTRVALLTMISFDYDGDQ
jgi:hypothetical protein